MESLPLSHPSPTTFSPVIHPLDNMSSPSDSSTAQHFLKLEDLHTASPASSYDTPAQCPSGLQTSPAPVIVHSKQAKKRKSWGQELPEPKTTLPPRKRAKTDDEKEQRRIERIKRNRAAAHNSRERKRQETETLAVALARANAELDAYRKIHGPLPASVVLPEVTVSTESADTPAPSLIESQSTTDNASSPPSPHDSSMRYDMTAIKSEPSDNSLPFLLPPAFENLDAKSSPLLPLDLTQHSAAMLCDLQCRSSRSLSRDLQHSTISWWSNLFLTLMTLQLQSCYKTLLTALWTLSPSRMARVMQASAHRLTSRSMTSSMTPRLSRSMAMAQLNAATSLSTRQGAPAALPRRSTDEGQRSEPTRVEQKHHSVIQRPALQEDGSRRDD
nr:transcriptional activator hac1 [Quercus suber]